MPILTSIPRLGRMEIKKISDMNRIQKVYMACPAYVKSAFSIRYAPVLCSRFRIYENSELTYIGRMK